MIGVYEAATGKELRRWQGQFTDSGLRISYDYVPVGCPNDRGANISSRGLTLTVRAIKILRSS
jgi:hypothetical protein